MADSPSPAPGAPPRVYAGTSSSLMEFGDFADIEADSAERGRFSRGQGPPPEGPHRHITHPLTFA